MKTIKEIFYVDENGNDQCFSLSYPLVKEIVEHRAMGEGDKWFYDVVREQDTIRIFNPTRVVFVQ